MKEALIEAGGTRIRPILMTAMVQFNYYLVKIVQFLFQKDWQLL